MKYWEYRKIINVIENIIIEDDPLVALSEKFVNVPWNTLASIYGSYMQRRVKKHFYIFNSAEESSKIYNEYCAAIEANEESGIIVRIAKALKFSSSMLAKIILEQYSLVRLGGSSKHQINKLMRDTSQIPDKFLSHEVYLCLLQDDVYGPFSDSLKHSIGHEFEFMLKKKLESLKISFQDESVLRNSGYDKTPDIKLDVPIAVDGRVVNWIESKASFGDEESHKNYLKDQLWSYWNRFGSGLVIYWFGFIEELDDQSERGIMVRSEFPENITFMEP